MQSCGSGGMCSPLQDLVWAPGLGGGLQLLADLEKLDLPLMSSPAVTATVLGEAIYYCCGAPASLSVLLGSLAQ